MKVSRDQLKEILRKVYKKSLLKEDHLEEYKSIIASELGHFFSNEKNLNLTEDYVGGQPVISIYVEMDKIKRLFGKFAGQVDGNVVISMTLKDKRIQ